jgi:RNA polymerase sigma-70 factor (ECF subfamily)
MTANRSNDEWLSALRTPGPVQEAALADLAAIIQNGLPYALSRWLSPSDPAFAPLIEETAQETLLRVMERLDTFQGRSQFTTWVQKIAVRIAISELRRQRWKDVSLDQLLESQETHAPPRLMEDPSAGPETAVERANMLERVQRIILEELSPKQRIAIIAIGVRGMPLEEVASRMGISRNALYKLLHDARLRLKKRLAAEGLSPGDILSAFEGG